MLADLAMFARFVCKLPVFLQNPLDLQQAKRQVQDQLRAREQTFLRIAKLGIYAQPQSPYFRLLQHAGISFEDLSQLTAKEGLEGALAQLHAAGVYVSLEEFKCRRPIQRGSLKFEVTHRDFDNPLHAGDYEVSSGGSRSKGTRIVVDLDLLSYEAAYHLIYQTMFNLVGRPMAIWRPLPPGSAGMKNSLYQLKTAQKLSKWFHQNKLDLDPKQLKYRMLGQSTISGSRLAGRPLPIPQYVPASRAAIVARWLAEMTARGTPALLDSNASSAVRVCLAAREHGLDIRGTFFRVGSEPFTPGKQRVLADCGAKATVHYSMSEVGKIGVGCGSPSTIDDVHVMQDKFALVQRQRHTGGSLEATVNTLLVTTLHPSTPKLMLNVESDDYAVLERRSCGCLLEQLGLGLHMHTIRSVEKLSSEGMSFIGSDLLRIVEEVLPHRFGGGATDYQFLEEEVAGLPKVSLVISPRLGALDDKQVIATVLESLAAHSGGTHLMAEIWKNGQTLRVIRTDPKVTAAGKILPLHINRARPAAVSLP